MMPIFTTYDKTQAIEMLDKLRAVLVRLPEEVQISHAEIQDSLCDQSPGLLLHSGFDVFAERDGLAVTRTPVDGGERRTAKTGEGVIVYAYSFHRADQW